jgi:hypothetical protein
MKSTKKTGRKQRHHVAANGKTLEGLSKQPDGRWRVIGTATRFGAKRWWVKQSPMEIVTRISNATET